MQINEEQVPQFGYNHVLYTAGLTFRFSHSDVADYNVPGAIIRSLLVLFIYRTI